jgi:hypothetical protein
MFTATSTGPSQHGWTAHRKSETNDRESRSRLRRIFDMSREYSSEPFGDIRSSSLEYCLNPHCWLREILQSTQLILRTNTRTVPPIIPLDTAQSQARSLSMAVAALTIKEACDGTLAIAQMRLSVLSSSKETNIYVLLSVTSSLCGAICPSCRQALAWVHHLLVRR